LPYPVDNQPMTRNQWSNETAEHLHSAIQEGDVSPEALFEVAGETIENNRYSSLDPEPAAGLWGDDTRKADLEGLRYRGCSDTCGSDDCCLRVRRVRRVQSVEDSAT
jgi:hypothetical protein